MPVPDDDPAGIVNEMRLASWDVEWEQGGEVASRHVRSLVPPISWRLSVKIHSKLDDDNEGRSPVDGSMVDAGGEGLAFGCWWTQSRNSTRLIVLSADDSIDLVHTWRLWQPRGRADLSIGPGAKDPPNSNRGGAAYHENIISYGFFRRGGPATASHRKLLMP